MWKTHKFTVLLCYDLLGHKLLGLRLHNQLCDTTLKEEQGQDNSDWFISILALCTKIELLQCKLSLVHVLQYSYLRLKSTVVMHQLQASKAAVISFFETLRVELGSDIGVTIVNPGLIESEMTKGKFLNKDGRMVVDQEMRDVSTALNLYLPSHSQS